MSAEHLSDLELDALRLGELPGDASALAEAHLGACPACQARRAALDASAADFAQRFVPAALAAETLARAETQRPWWRQRLAVWVPAAASAVAAVLLLSPVDAVRTKGAGGAVEVFVLDGDTPRSLSGPVPAGARLAVRVSPGPAPAWARLYWRSTEGVAPLHPAPDAAAWALTTPTWLEREVVLDDAPGPEALVAVLCAAPVSDDEARAVMDDEERAGCRRDVVAITKR